MRWLWKWKDPAHAFLHIIQYLHETAHFSYAEPAKVNNYDGSGIDAKGCWLIAGFSFMAFSYLDLEIK